MPVLIDDLPKLVQIMKGQISGKDRKEMQQAAEKESTGIFDTHPCEKERIAAAEALNTDGMWKIELPAREPFRHYDALCRNVTQDFYRNQIGRIIDPNEMEPVEKHFHSILAP